MTSDISKSVIDAIRKLYRSNSAAQALFDWTAQRERDATATSIVNFSNRLGISRGEAVGLARALEQAGCGQFVVGRRGQPSRFEWRFSCISLGQAAAGEDVKLEAAEDPLPESEEEKLEADDAAAEHPLTLSQAKLALSRSLGVPIENIEITIKA
jgi:hypothetical protein